MTRGMDIGLNWTADLGDGGSSFYINSQVTLLDEFKIQDAAGEPILDVRDTLSTTYYGAQYKYKLIQHVRLQLPERSSEPRAELAPPAGDPVRDRSA